MGREREKAFFIVERIDLRLPVLRGQNWGNGLWGKRGRRRSSSRNVSAYAFRFCGAKLGKTDCGAGEGEGIFQPEIRCPAVFGFAG